MPTLPRYEHFDGRYWDTGLIHNYFAYQGVRAPHTGRPYTEAMLMGVSGGVMMGYFSFAYKGHDPYVAVLTRNTFDPLDTLLTRLGVVQNLKHTTNAKKGLKNLLDALDDGSPAIVWADAFSLPYNDLPRQADAWAMFPILVYGHEAETDQALIADRAAVPLTVTTGELARARARVKKDKFRVLTLEPPDPKRLPAAVQQGLWDCLRRYTEPPVKSASKSFGLAAFQHWAELLTNHKHRQSWAKVFPPGIAMYSGLASAYHRFSMGAVAAQNDRDLYAEFLEEAAALLKKPALKQSAERFRASALAWRELGRALLPGRIAPFKETRELLDRRGRLFIAKGGRALKEIQKINQRLKAIRAQMGKSFPLSEAAAAAHRQRIREQVLKVGEMEKAAHGSLQAAMADGRR